MNIFNTNYREFEIVDNFVYAVTNGDSLVRVDLINNTICLLKKNIKNIAKTKKSKILALTLEREVIKFTDNSNFKVIDVFIGNPHKILIDKKDNTIILSTECVRYKKKNYFPNEDSNMYLKSGRLRKDKQSIIPADVYYIDDKYRVWFGYDAGEWGGDICFFDLKRKKLFDEKYVDTEVPNEKYTEEEMDKWNPKFRFKTKAEELRDYPKIVKAIEGDTVFKFPYQLYISNIKGIAQNEVGDYYFATSLMHFFVRSNLEKKIKTQFEDFYRDIDLTDVLEHRTYKERTEEYIDQNNVVKKITVPMLKESLEYLGGLTYNTYNNHIYYYTNTGFWKLIENDTKISKEFVFKPLVLWTYGLPDAIGYQMNVTKFEFISENKMIFLTTNNGIGYYDGKEVVYFK